MARTTAHGREESTALSLRRALTGDLKIKMSQDKSAGRASIKFCQQMLAHADKLVTFKLTTSSFNTLQLQSAS